MLHDEIHVPVCYIGVQIRFQSAHTAQNLERTDRSAVSQSAQILK